VDRANGRGIVVGGKHHLKCDIPGSHSGELALCSHVEVDRRFRGAYCLHYQGEMFKYFCNVSKTGYNSLFVIPLIVNLFCDFM
jgi:hypothetical protein